ncbi:TetR/AcrR family transcriptional regulator [Novosphingobium flavum]|uniref:TetR/AcrR family transcriptional regulator n=1 Tax=Novosphingobium aerophilum TaxID=2839843 RepID=A0A7X1F6D4_9SPHN|nr:TetR/AcrR family transcriptional regulator [Novosphingobium aerophilum]MBC2650909.1 TetR/AcrR family transcriptional regulator [Novosphingobium aerophilum]MBC2663541.1 TetR/AcrR family transcriptional regulator [Novosphingobium aerophilum]
MSTEQHEPEQRQKGRPSVEEAARIDRLILSAARNILVAHGESASLNAVAKAAGLSRKTVYARYASKEALFLAAARSALVDTNPITFPPAATLEDRLYNYLVEVFRLISSDAALSFQRALVTNAHLLPQLRDAIREASANMIFQPLQDMLAEAFRNGELDAEDPQLVARIVFDTVVGQMTTQGHEAPGRGDPAILRAYAGLLARMVCRGLCPRAAGLMT